MEILILIEPATDGRYRATAGSPFDVSIEADSPDEATRQLGDLLRERLQRGSRLQTVDLGNGSGTGQPGPDLGSEATEEWFFRAMEEGIAEFRSRVDAMTAPA